MPMRILLGLAPLALVLAGTAAAQPVSASPAPQGGQRPIQARPHLPEAANPSAPRLAASAIPLFALSPDKTGVYEYDGSSWTKIGGPAAAIYARNSNLFATNPTTGDVYGYLGTPDQWSRVGSPGREFAVDDNGDLYGLNSSGVFEWTGTGESWTKIGGPAAAIYAGGTTVFATNPTTRDIYEYLGTPDQWSRVGSPGREFAVAGDGTLYGLNSSGVFEWTGTGDSWTKIGGPAAAIAA
jgi:Tectonin domain